MSDPSQLTSAEKSSQKVQKLKEDGSNWVLYKDDIFEVVCGHVGYRRHITGRAKQPVKPADLIIPANASARERTQLQEDHKKELDNYKDEMDDWVQKQSAIRST